MAMAHVDKVFAEFSVFNELLQLLHIEFILLENIMLGSLADDPFPTGHPQIEKGEQKIIEGTSG